MSNSKDKYREETNCDVYSENPPEIGVWCYTNEYVHWLENQRELFASGITQKMLDAENYVKKYTYLQDEEIHDLKAIISTLEDKLLRMESRSKKDFPANGKLI